MREQPTRSGAGERREGLIGEPALCSADALRPADRPTALRGSLRPPGHRYEGHQIVGDYRMMQNLGKASRPSCFTAARCNERKQTVVIARNPLQSSGPAQGAAGIVKCCLNRKTDKRRACKIIKRGDVACMARIDREIRAMTLLKHPNVVQLHEVSHSMSRASGNVQRARAAERQLVQTNKRRAQRRPRRLVRGDWNRLAEHGWMPLLSARLLGARRR